MLLTPTACAQETPAELDSEPEPIATSSGPTELWIHGALGDPESVAELGATGLRGVVDMRSFRASGGIELFEKCADLDLGVCVTLRWQDPRKAHEELPPSDAESANKLEELMTALTSEPARRLGDRLWIQFYNELGSGSGRVAPDQADGMFRFATQAATRIRAEAPHVRMCGPALTGVEVEDEDGGGRRGRRRRALIELNERILQWTIDHADAIDVHLHTDSVDHARHRIESLKEHLEKRPGGERLAIVAWEWSPAHFPNRDDTDAVRTLVLDLWTMMNEMGIEKAAYGSLYPARQFGDAFGWQSIFLRKGYPREPFHSTLKSIAAKAAGAGPETTTDGNEGH